MDHPGVITLQDLLTFVGEMNDTWATPWVPWPAEVGKRQLVVGMKAVLVGRLGVQLQTSWDMITPIGVGSRMGISIQETRIDEGTAEMGPWIRLQLSADAPVTECVVSAWATPKRY